MCIWQRKFVLQSNQKRELKSFSLCAWILEEQTDTWFSLQREGPSWAGAAPRCNTSHTVAVATCLCSQTDTAEKYKNICFGSCLDGEGSNEGFAFHSHVLSIVTCPWAMVCVFRLYNPVLICQTSRLAVLLKRNTSETSLFWLSLESMAPLGQLYIAILKHVFRMYLIW